jgi:TRAP transporter TAXI family solute receptor
MGLWTRYVIPAGSYPGQTQDIRTIAQPNFLAVRADVDEDAVYRITKAIYENLPFLNGIHKATKAMALNKAIAGLPMPLHPGAARYYREAGLEIPQRLIVD